jgi:REP element-mobilizing transposase RayT
VEGAIHSGIRVECAKLKAEALEVNGIEDHVHVLVRIPATITIAQLVKQMKGASSHMTTHTLKIPGEFKWQGAYAAFTVSEYEVPKVRQYIRNQKQHHQSGNVIPRYELLLDDESAG